MLLTNFPFIKVSGEESPGVMSNEDLPESPTDGDIDEESLTTNMPWLKVLSRILSFIRLFNRACLPLLWSDTHTTSGLS